MFQKGLIVIASLALVGAGFAKPVEAASIYTLDLDATNPNNTQTLNLDAGNYKIELLGIAEGGSYDAWRYTAASINCPNVCTRAFSGWVNYFSFISSDIIAINSTPVSGASLYSGGEGYIYNTAEAANAAFSPLEFSLGADSTVDFELRDIPYTDNTGGLTLKISQLSEPEISQVPEPKSFLSFFALSTVISAVLKYKQAHRKLG